jgi:hypothetical protein
MLKLCTAGCLAGPISRPFNQAGPRAQRVRTFRGKLAAGRCNSGS